MKVQLVLLREQGIDETEILLLRRKNFYSDANECGRQVISGKYYNLMIFSIDRFLTVCLFHQRPIPT